MQTFKLAIITPDSTLFDAEVIAVILPGTEGSFEILSNHAPIVAMVKSGNVEITDTNKEKIHVAVPGGFFEFQKNVGVLLCTPAEKHHG
jgi:F-type H+-transporting ATPase subunit epsilon